MVMIPFDEWKPDSPDFANTGTSALNVIPSPNGYRPFNSLSAQTNALTARCLGSFAEKDSSGNVYFYAGDASKLYEATNNTFADESKVGGYSTASGDSWEFAKYDNKIIATNYTDAVQSIDIGGGVAGAFADHITSTNKPKAKHLDVVGNFLVLGNTNDATDGAKTNRVWWPAIGDSTDFDPDSTTQSDYEDLKEGGAVQKIVGGAEYGVVFQERAIRRMAYIGSPTIFDIDAVDRQRGTPIPNSVVAHGRLVFYISEEGFFGFDGSSSTPIGNEKVDRTFWAQFDINYKDRVSSAIDPVNKLVAWAFPGTGSTGGNPNRIYLFHWPTGKWAESEVNTEILVKSFTQGYTLDGLDSISTNIDTGFTESFDSDVWKGGKLRFGAFDTSHKLAYFTGSSLDATIETGEAQLFGGRRALVREAWPVIDGGTITVSVGGRNRQIDSVSYDSAIAQNSAGFCPVRNESRYQRFKVSITGTWTHAQGLDIIGSPRGKW